MTNELIARVIRWAATAGLVYMVYTETGPWTALFCMLVALGHETQRIINRRSDAMADIIYAKFNNEPPK